MTKLCRNNPFCHVMRLCTCKCMYVWMPLVTWSQLFQTLVLLILQGQRNEYVYTLIETNRQHNKIPPAENNNIMKGEKRSI